MKVNIKTSFFAGYKGQDGIAISRGVPKGWKGPRMMDLCPPWNMIKNHGLSQAEWEKWYRENILVWIDFDELMLMINNKVLLCWEKPGQFCHRRIVAKWIEENTGVEVPEWQAEDKAV